MKRDKLVAKIDSTLEEYYSNGWHDGWSDGYDAGAKSGVEAHKEMIRNRLKMYLDTCMNTNKLREAQFTSEMIQYLMWEYDSEQAEADLKAEKENSDGYGLIL